MKYLLVLLTVVLVGSTDDEIDRRGFFKKIRDAYVEGRMTANEKRIAERRAQEKVRRRYWFERNINKLTDGLSKRLQRGPSYIKVAVLGGVVLTIWLCHRGSVGCDRDNDK